VKINGIAAGIIAGSLGSACSPPPRPSPYVTSGCPLPAGVHGYPVAAHDPAGTLDTGTLSPIARAVATHLAISTHGTHEDSIPDDIAGLMAAFRRNQPLARGEWSPAATDTASILIVYRGGTPTPVIRSAGPASHASDFTRRALRAATLARDLAQKRRPQTDTLPLDLGLPAGDSVVVLLRFGSQPGPADGVAHFAVQERDVQHSGRNQPRYPTTLKSARMAGEVAVAFVVGTDSAPDMSTLRVLRSAHPDFTESVLDALVRDRYVPLELDCRVVRTMVMQPYIFRMIQGAR
jgi:hypothetical protein